MRYQAFFLVVLAAAVMLGLPEQANARQHVDPPGETPSIAAAEQAGEHPLARQGVRAMNEGRFEDAEKLFSELARDDPDGHYHLARLYLTDGFVDARSAHIHLGEAREDDPDNPKYLRERLRQLRSGLPFFTSGMDRSGERNSIARRLLEIHGGDAVALEEIATTAAWDYFWFERRFGADAGSRMRERIDAYLEEAIEHFELAIEANPTRIETYREYLRILIRAGRFDAAHSASAAMTVNLPDLPESWLLRGLTMHIARDPERAWPRFGRGLSLMDPREREAFDAWHLLVRRDLRDSLIAAGDEAEEAFWRLRDTRRMTGINERLVSHYGRLVYADLFYPRWREHLDDEWLITPGDVIVRYGYPRSEQLPRTDPFSAGGPTPTVELLLTFANESFVFEDWNGDGEFLIPTTPGQDDPVTLARSDFYEEPELADSPGKENFTVPYVVTRFPSPTGPAELVVSYGVPVFAEEPGRDLPIATRSGVFVVDDEGYDVDRFVLNSPRMRADDLVRADTLLLWTNTTTLSVEPGAYRLQIEVESENRIASHRQTVDVAAVNEEGPWISDILPATLVEPATGRGDGIVRAGYRIRPASMNVISRDAPFYLYFELGGLDVTSGTARYETEIIIGDVDGGGLLNAINRLFTGDGARVTASFESSIESAEDEQYFILDLRDEEPGPHVIGLRITDLTSGRTVESSRRIEIR